MPIEIDFRKHLLEPSILKLSLWKECTPKILIVTDGLNYSSSDDFGLTQFVSTLSGSTIHGMIPTVVKASRNVDAGADISNFDFAHPAHGLLKSRYDVAFLFGFSREGSVLPAAQADAIARFMQDGGGVFATGDHEDIGAAMGLAIPRVRNMRFWRSTETPHISDDTRLSTNLPGDNGIYEFDDQADVHPQKLYVNYRTMAGGIGNPHPLLQGGLLGPIEVFPDHPHEGECRLPGDMETKFSIGRSEYEEWPVAVGGGGRVSPEMVALTMSHGDEFPGKQALTPRAFMAICAYDGHKANVGRVATDATWHHFVNVNIDGSGSPRSGMQNPPGTDTPDMLRIRQYYRNLAAWLMPKNTRRCLRYPLLISEMRRYPLYEELRIPPLAEAKGEELRQIGQQIASGFSAKHPTWLAEELISDALENGVGEEMAARLSETGGRYGLFSARDMGLAALGAIVCGLAAKLGEIAGSQETDPHKLSDKDARDSARIGVKRHMEGVRTDWLAFDSLLMKVAAGRLEA